MVVIAFLSIAFIRIFSTTLDATRRINDRNQLLYEAQIAEKVMAARIKLAWYVYPNGSRILINNGQTTFNALAGSNTWTVGSDPIIAMILPPKIPGRVSQCSTSNPEYCFRFFAYYAFPRSHYLTSIAASSAEALFPDPPNDSTWVLMEFRANLTNYHIGCPTIPPPNNDAVYAGKKARLLAEYVQPESTSPSYTIFTVHSDGTIDLALRMLKHTSKRSYHAPLASQPALTFSAAPRNIGVGCSHP